MNDTPKHKYDFDEVKLSKIIDSMREYYYRNKSEL